MTREARSIARAVGAMTTGLLLSTATLVHGRPLHAQAQPPATAPSGDAAPQQPPSRWPNLPQGQPPRTDLRAPEHLQVVRDVVYAMVTTDAGEPIELKMDVAFPKQSDDKPLPVVIYIHGGGWVGGDRAAGMPFTLAFANGGYFAATISYRLADQAICPAAIHDCKAAVRFIRAHADELAIDPDRIGVWGHSAGGHLSAMLAVSSGVEALEGDAAGDEVSTEVACAVDVSGPSDLALLGRNEQARGFITRWLGGTVSQRATEAKQASPVTHVNAGDAPMLIVHGDRDELVPIQQAELLRDALHEAGVEAEYHAVKNAGHAISDRQAYRAVAEFFDRHLGGSAAESLRALLRAGQQDGEREKPTEPAASRPEKGDYDQPSGDSSL